MRLTISRERLQEALTAVTALGTSGAVAVATRIPNAADRRRGHIATRGTQSSAMGSITGTLTCGWRIGPKYLRAPFGAVAIALLPAGPVAIRRAPMMPTEGGADTA